jgi:CheY-like chemotaxis protein
LKGEREIALKANCDGYLTKPIDTRTFVLTITSFLPPCDGENAAA